jgi:hypothetical protein
VCVGVCVWGGVHDVDDLRTYFDLFYCKIFWNFFFSGSGKFTPSACPNRLHFFSCSSLFKFVSPFIFLIGEVVVLLGYFFLLIFMSQLNMWERSSHHANIFFIIKKSLWFYSWFVRFFFSSKSEATTYKIWDSYLVSQKFTLISNRFTLYFKLRRG